VDWLTPSNKDLKGDCGGTCPQLIIEEQGRVSAELSTEQAAGLDREAVVVPHQHVVDTEECLNGVAQEYGLVAHTVIHVHLIALNREKKVDRGRERERETEAE